VQSAKPQVKPVVSTNRQAQGLHTAADTRTTNADTELAAAVIASRATTQPIETVIAVPAARRSGATVNAAAKAAGINYRTAQRIAEAAAERRQTDLVAAS
jgi:hypothetical protein